MKNKIKVIKKYSTETALVVCNEGKLHQAFLNVIVNAIQAIEDSGIITIQTKSMADHFVVSISDNGKGISEENVQKIFDPFFTTKPIGKGTGLGLSISYNIIKEHNGRIECESALGIGTKFTFIVPTKEGIMV
jgi:signal transduction histidine kinase